MYCLKFDLTTGEIQGRVTSALSKASDLIDVTMTEYYDWISNPDSYWVNPTNKKFGLKEKTESL
jgi:hypothetical protein